jgi:hypothetical protein
VPQNLQAEAGKDCYVLEGELPSVLYDVGVQEVGTDECNDRKNFYFGRYKADLVYAGMNVGYGLHFLMQNVTKADGKLKSFQDIRKYRDAILWGSKVECNVQNKMAAYL